MPDRRTIRRLIWVSVFAVAFAFVEASVVVYLRAIYYPAGFSFPLRTLSGLHGATELVREAATIVMLISVAAIAGRSAWQRVGYVSLAFGVWDIFFYVWLRAVLGWPARLTDWDILFLIPVPWIGPVIAPVLVSVLMVVSGALLVGRTSAEQKFRPGFVAWILALAGVAVLLASFMTDTEATLHGSMPRPYSYEMLSAGLLLCIAAAVLAFRHRSPLSR